MKHPGLQNAFFGIHNPEIFSKVLDQFKQHSSCSFCETRVDLATHRTLVQLCSRILGGMHPGSTLSFELAALVVSVARTRPARAFKSLLFAEN